MIISRLEIHGFKSFADKVSLDFQKGITAVVGPNGCGKSNIVDAIRWVMGEQSAKTLRGKNMEDTIFGGSEVRKPLGMTEVSLFFSTEDGRIPAKYLNFSEIQVTRRLYRDGESDYLLNGAQCRLMDITELFMDTGAGAKAYSIIEQGKIGMILSSKPEERRLIIEEAAGVTKFKARKQVALKKIEATKQNLLRIGDIIAEIRRQLNSLQRQAKKAEKFREYREELKEIELLFAVAAYLALQEQKGVIENELGSLRESEADNSLAMEGLSLSLDEKRTVLLEEEKKLNEAQEEGYRLRGEITGRENRLGFERKELAALDERMTRSTLEKETLHGRMTETGEERKKLEETGANLLVSLGEEENGLTESEAVLERLSEEERCLSRALDERRRELFGVLSEISQFNNQHAAAAKRLETLRDQLERNRREGVGVLEKLQEASERVTGLESLQTGLKDRKEKLDHHLSELRSREAGLRKDLETAEHDFHRERDLLSKASSRLHSLQELEAQFAGYGRGVRSLFLAQQFKDRLKGVIADILEVGEEYEVALEAALADRLQYVICDGEADARAAITFLRETTGGRCSLILRNQSAGKAAEAPKGATRLIEMITVSDGERDIAEALLANTYLADDFDTALDLGRRFPQLTFVTRDGEMVSGGGVIHGGSMEAAQQGLIHKKRRIKELTAEVNSLTIRVGEIESMRGRLRNELSSTEEGLKESRQELHRVEIDLVNADKDLLRGREECQRLGERLAVKELEDEQLKEEQDSLEREMERSILERTAREQRREVAEGELTELQTSLADKQRGIDEAREAVTVRKVRLAALREKRESVARTVGRVEEVINDLHQRRSQLEKELEEGVREKERLAASITSGVDELKDLMEKHLQMESLCSVIRTRYEELSGQVAEIEARLKGLHATGAELAQGAGEKSLRLAEIGMRLGNLEETLAGKYRVTLSELVPLYENQAFDESEKRGRQAELESLIEGIGEVNLTAIEEYRDLEERFEFLSGQKEDLEESLHGLQQAIQRINRTTRKRFLDTFNLVNEKFQEVFPRLFCGGRAELRLTNEEDLLETGIDIIIQPPGKKLQNVNLLSGGEKALTAVALMFAIFLIKPAPFCILDEVDAPLDEANIGRFNEIVREMSSFSQFIIITHNKATMTNANTLYGVTMEEPGVSKLVSVRLQ